MLALAAAAWTLRAAAEGVTLTAGARGYDGASPGPVLRARAGEPLRLTFVNGLDRPTSLRLPGFLSGPLAPGARREIAAIPGCGFDLYGPADAAAPALFGAVVVEDGAPADLDLIALLSGDSLVNGGPAPLRVEARPGARVRLRIANAGQDAALAVRTSGCDARIAAIDGRPCDLFAPREGAFPLCPGARVELLFDLGAGFALEASGRPRVQIAPVGAPLPKRPALKSLPADPRLPEDIALEKALQVKVTVGPGGFNGGAGRTLFAVKRGRPVTLTLVNTTAQPETLRLEAHAARILHAFDDGFDPYWRDVLALGPGQTLHAAFVADVPGRWPLASVSGTKGRFGWFEVA